MHILWQIWKTRNNFVFRRILPDPTQVVAVASANAHVARCCNGVLSGSQLRTSNPNRVWCPLKPGTLKINIDGAFPTATNEGSVASVCRDHFGQLVGEFTSSITASSALQIEIQALTLTLKNLLLKGMENEQLLLEFDYLVLVEAVHHPCSTP